MSAEFSRKILFYLSVIFALQGLMWVFLGSFDPLGIHDQLMGDVFYNGRVPPEIRAYQSFIMIPFGATDFAYFVLYAGICHIGLQSSDALRWWKLLVGALLGWFVIDSIGCFVMGAAFNVYMVNIPCLVMLGIPLLMFRRSYATQA